MATLYRDEAADLSALRGETIGVIGYGSQGRSRALDHRDSGLSAVVGIIEDASRIDGPSGSRRASPRAGL